MKGKIIKDCLDGIEEVLKEYSDKENYWTTSRSLPYVSNGHTEETFDCTCCDPDASIKGLYWLHMLKEQMNEENN